MNKTQHTISEAAKALHVEAHVLRYWEEELTLHIPRNNMGHRIYGEKEMALLQQIIQWKEEGLSLKEIQLRCSQENTSPDRERSGQIIPYPTGEAKNTDSQVKMEQFKKILGRIVSDAIRDNSEELTSDIASDVSDQVNKELDFLFREKEDADEKRFRLLDESIRSMQKTRQEAAAAQIPEIKSRPRRKFGKYGKK